MNLVAQCHLNSRYAKTLVSTGGPGESPGSLYRSSLASAHAMQAEGRSFRYKKKKHFQPPCHDFAAGLFFVVS